MLNYEIIDYHSTGLDKPWAHEKQGLKSFLFYLDFYVREISKEGSSFFTIAVCSPDNVYKCEGESSFLLLSTLDFEYIEKVLKVVLSECLRTVIERNDDADDLDVGFYREMNKYFSWEYAHKLREN